MSGYAPQRPGVMAARSAPTVAYGLYASPRSGNQGCGYVDGAAEGGDPHPGAAPWPDRTSHEVPVACLTHGHAVAYCCACARAYPPDARAVVGSPEAWLRLPPRDS
ncbi:hypothetical protein [Streptomyces sp. NPDC057877]|uniref:hypothetical protein n=1 Tax=Streptomyces sp. NPDC057877 TaxID=3346269 RepID=UPI0036A8DB31